MNNYACCGWNSSNLFKYYFLLATANTHPQTQNGNKIPAMERRHQRMIKLQHNKKEKLMVCRTCSRSTYLM